MTMLKPVRSGWKSLETILNKGLVPAINQRTPIQGDLILLEEIKGGTRISVDTFALQSLINQSVAVAFK